MLRTSPPECGRDMLLAKGWLHEAGAADRYRLPHGVAIADAIELCVRAGVRVEAAHPIEMTLEELYLEMIRGDSHAVAPLPK